jgi:hypothetical protein
MIRIVATVSGGQTGPRKGWLRENGQVREFASLGEAKRVAEELTAMMKGKGRRGVIFRYAATEREEL